MWVWSVCLWGLLLLLAARPPAWSRSFPATPDAALDAQQRWGTALESYIVQGCLPTGSGLTLTVPPCRGYARVTDDPATLKGFEEETARTLPLPSSDGATWLVARWSPALTPVGWTCQPGTHYCWLASPTQPPWPSGTVRLAKVVVQGGAITSVQPLLPPSLMEAAARDGNVSAVQYGLRCDDATDNSAALAAALDALPPTGGVLTLPAADLPCRYTQPLVVTKSITVRGAGGSRANPKTPRTVLKYMGSGTAITIRDVGTQGTKLIGFELNHGGTAEVGVAIDATSSVLIDDFAIALPTVLFSVAGIRIGHDLTSTPHSIFLQNVYIRGAAPVGVWVVQVSEFMTITDSKILRHTSDNIILGRLSSEGGLGLAEDVHILHSTLESPNPGSNAVTIKRAEGVWIKDCHFEVGPPLEGNPARALQINALTSRAAPIVFADNRVVAMPGATEVILLAFAQGLLSVERNWFQDNSGGTLTSWVNNLNGRYLVVGLNRHDGPFPLVAGRAYLTLTGNWRQDSTNRVDGFWPYRLCQSATVVGTVGAGESVLGTCTIESDMLFEGHMGVTMTFAGRTAANGNSKRVRVYVGSTDPGQVIFDSGAVAANDDHWRVHCVGLRGSPTLLRVTCQGQIFDVQTGPKITTTELETLGWSGPRPITVTGTGDLTNDVLLHVQQVHITP